MIRESSGLMTFDKVTKFKEFLRKSNNTLLSILEHEDDLDYIFTHPITFLFPDLEYTNFIVELAESNSELLKQHLYSLFIVGTFNSVKSMIGVKFTTLNCKEFKVSKYGAGIKLQSTDGGTVEAIIEPYNNKTELGNDIMVWAIKSGRIPITGRECSYDNVDEKKVSKDSKRDCLPRRKIASIVEKRFIAYAESKSGCNPYLKYTLSLLNCIVMNHPELLESMLPRLHMHPVATFYLLLEPYKTKGTFLLSHELIDEWNGDILTKTNDPATEYKLVLEYIKKKVKNEESKEGCYILKSDISQLFGNIDAIRSNIGKKRTYGPNAMIVEIRKAYELLYKDGKIGTIENVLPFKTIDIDQQLFIFEFIVETVKLFQTIENAITFDSCVYDEFRMLVRSYKPGNSYDKELSYTKSDCYKNVYLNIDKSIGIRTLTSIINSSTFLIGCYEMFIPYANDSVESFDLNDLNKVVNLSKIGEQYLNKKLRKHSSTLVKTFESWTLPVI